MDFSQIFKDNNQQFSSMRVMSFISLIVAIVATFTGSSIDIIIIWITGAFAPKTIQKFAENKTQKT